MPSNAKRKKNGLKRTGPEVQTIHDDESIDDVALLIDWENFKIGVGKAKLERNVTALYEASRAFGRVVIARAFMDWFEKGMENDPHALYRAGVEPVYVPKRRVPTKTGREHEDPVIKNSVDVRMAAEAATLCHTNPNIRTFVLVSGDQDFLHVVNALRPFGRRVILIGVTTSLSQRLVEFVDQVIYYDRDIEGNRVAGASGDSGEELPPLEIVLNAIQDILKTSSTPGVGLFSHIGNEVRKRFPKYHPRVHGFTTFKQLMDKAIETGIIEATYREGFSTGPT